MLRTLAKLAALAALGWVCSAHALGLGEIEIKSRLNQPLSATIPISSATPRELESLNIELAGNEEFERSGMERPEFLSSLKFEIKDNVIRVTSKDLAREPFVSFLLDVRWTGGRLLREYTVLLDPPTLAQAPKPVPSPVEGPVAERPAPRMAERPAESPVMSQAEEEAPPAQAMTEESPTPEAEEPAVASTPRPAPEPSVAYDGETYGPVQPKETLWSIAYKLRPDSSLTMDQMQVAIFNANPKAFEDGRLTGLMKGTVIRIPGADEIRAVDPVSAKAQVAQANRTSGRPVAVAPPPPAPAEQEAVPAAALTTVEPAPPPAPEPAPQTPPAEPSATAPPATEQAAPSGDQPAAAQTSPAQAGDSAAADTDMPVDPSQMVDEPAQAVTTQPAPDEAVKTEPLPPPTAAPVETVEEPGLLDQVMEQALALIDHPLFFPVAGGLVVLLILVVLGGKLRDKFAQWSYERASRKKMVPTAQLMTDTMEAPVAQPSMAPLPEELEQADADAATVVRDQPMRAPRAEQDMAATATQAMVAETQQQTLQQTLQQTHAQTQAPEPAAAQTGGPKVDFDVSGTYATETVQINLDAGDPVSEAEFHRAYGLYDEAALLLKQALQKEPARTDARVKLAEIYFEANKAAEFVETAKQLKGQLPDAEWQKIALLGSQIAAGNDLFQGATAGGTVDLSFDEPTPAPAAAAPSAKAAPAPAAGGDMLDFTMDDINKLADVAPPAAAGAGVPSKPAADGALEFDLGSLSLDTPAAVPSAPPAPAPAKSVPAAAVVTGGDDFKMDDLNLGDFDLKLDTGAASSAEPALAPAPAAAAPESIDMGGELSLDETPAAGDESSTKLDLARAYMDMGDNDMAKSLLNEVQQQGSAQQKKEAQELLSRVAA